MTAIESDLLAGRLVEFVRALRSKGVRAGTSETVDAAAIIDLLGLDDREQLREGLAAALVRRGGQRDVFDQVFDIYFPRGEGSPTALDEAESPEDLEQLRDQIADALLAGDTDALDRLAAIAVDMLGEVGNVDGAAGGWSAFQTLDRLSPHTLIAQVAGQLPAAASSVVSRIARDEVRANVDRLRDAVASEARRRTATVRGRDVVTRHAVRANSDRIDFLSASKQQLDELRQAVGPLSRKLATRLAARRARAQRGRIDIRRTLRRSLGTGGVPINPAYAKPNPARPELVLLCDVSGSVAGFSNFTMHLVQALGSQFSKVRVFAFVNAMDEVTDLVREHSDDLAQRISEQAKLTKWHTSSDYGEAFGDFAADYLNAVGPRTCVLILGDARNNNQSPNTEALHQIAERAKRTFWLNPEAQIRWGLGDSIAPEYADVVPMHECCNVDQLAHFIGRLLPV